ncbi:hypothetical protein Kisp02_52650 [Kineosporia sp. NBRC 101731]|nr:hypothetical protein Kisp02_52650 [Kineosporia sp. NBRC 101731]
MPAGDPAPRDLALGQGQPAAGAFAGTAGSGGEGPQHFRNTLLLISPVRGIPAPVRADPGVC